jgi:hypothetical protein
MNSAALVAAVERLVMETKSGLGVIRTGEAAKRLFAEHGDSGMSCRQIGEIVARTAIAAGVAIQFTSAE